MIYVTIVFEDELSEAVMSRILSEFSDKYQISHKYPGHGFGYLKTNIKGFNQASVVNPHFMLTDLDRYECPSELLNDWIDFTVNPDFIFRIAVREVESWLLADVMGLSKFFNISPAKFPSNPDGLIDPKEVLIKLAKRSRKREIREDIVPVNQNASIGPNYNGCLSLFVYNFWSFEEAAKRSESLQRTCQKLKDFEESAGKFSSHTTN